jgi:hypothetical protein
MAGLDPAIQKYQPLEVMTAPVCRHREAALGRRGDP